MDASTILCIFAVRMQRLKHFLIWLSRISHCRGFGIQSPTDYGFVRYVINEHWPYYRYNEVGQSDDWLTRKLGHLYFRLANWRQPKVILCRDYQPYLQAGCRAAALKMDADHADLIHMKLEGDYRSRLSYIYKKVDTCSVLILEGIRKDMAFWQEVVDDERTGITFDLYYCGIVMFDVNRFKQNYIINF